MKPNKQNKIQQEVEKLSWEFIAELHKLNSKKNRDKNEIEFLSNEARTAQKENKEKNDMDEINNFTDSKMEFLFMGGKNNSNDGARSERLVMDEDVLKPYKIKEWHKPPKIRLTFYEKIFSYLLRGIIWPFKTVLNSLLFFTKFIYQVIFFATKKIFYIFYYIVSLFWDFIKAFKYAWIYLFGDLSWLNLKGSLHQDAIISTMTPKINIFRTVWRRTAILTLILLLLILPVGAYLSYSKFVQIKGKVLGVSEEGFSHFKQASEAGKERNFKKANKEFILAAANFNQAIQKMNNLGGLSNQLADLLPEVKSAKELIHIASLSSEAGKHLTRAANFLDNYNLQMVKATSFSADKKILTPNSIKIDRNNLSNAAQEISLAYQQASTAAGILNKIDLSNIKFNSYRDKINSFKDELPILLNWLKQGNDTAQILAYLLGVDSPKRLMLVFQNNTELRPSGGFMGSYAIVDVKNGQIKKIDVPGGGFYDLKGSLAVKVDAPYPFHLFSPIWQPWNANWFFDWPTSAQKIEWFYDKSGGPTVDGIIAFTPNVLADILKVVGEIDMPDYNLKINSDNFIRLLQTQVEFGYDKEENQPKKIIADLMPKLLAKLSQVDKNKLIELWQFINNDLKQKQILVYTNNSVIEGRIKSMGWGGEVLPAKLDYLAVIHTNVAGGKTDQAVKNSIRHQVKILADGRVIDKLELTRTHKGDEKDVFLGATNIDYVRFYVPKGSRLLKASGFDALPKNRKFQWEDELKKDVDLARVDRQLKVDKENDGMRISQEFDKTVFGNWIIVRPGEKQTVSLEYILPFKLKIYSDIHTVARKKNWWALLKQYFLGYSINYLPKTKQVYSLLVQKQPGLNSVDFKSVVLLPAGWRVSDFQSNKDLFFLNNNEVDYEDNLVEDGYYRIVLQ